MADTALLVIDIQNDYFPGGAMALEGAVEAGERAAQALGGFRSRGLPVFHVRHESTRPDAAFLLPGTPGADIHPCVAPRPGEPVVEKHYPNAFRDTDLLARLREYGAKRLVFAGMMTHMCIDTTVRAAFDLGFDCTLLHDATATRALAWRETAVPAREVQHAFVAALGSVFATVLETQAFLQRIGPRDSPEP